MPAPAPTPMPVPPAPTTLDMIHAIRAVQCEQAAKIGAAAVVHVAGKTPISMAEFATEVEILAGLDLAATVLQASV